MPPLLAGREDILADAEELLTRAAALRRGGSSPLVWTGVRGVGKTVTLEEVRTRAGRQRFLAAHVTADRSGGLAFRLAESLASTVAEADLDRAGRRWEQFVERLSAFSLQVSVAGVVTLGTTGTPSEATPAKVSRDMLRQVVEDVAGQAVDAGRPGLLLTFDELQEAPIEDLAVLVHVLQELTVSGSRVVSIAAGLPRLPERLMEAGSFAERFAYRRLQNLTEQAALKALIGPAEELDVHWDPQTAEGILALAAGSPYLLQLYAEAAWRAARPDAGEVIGPQVFAQGVAEAERALWDGQYRGGWNRATAAEKELLVAVAQVLDGNGVATTRDIGAHLGKTTPQLSRARADLIDKGLLESVGHGLLGFTVPGFERFVRHQADQVPAEGHLPAGPSSRPVLPPEPTHL